MRSEITSCTDSFKLTFNEMEKIAGLPIDHSFLNCKKELLNYGYKVGKNSLKGKTVDFEKVQGEYSIYPFVYALQNGASLDYGDCRAKMFDAACPDEGRVRIHGEVID